MNKEELLKKAYRYRNTNARNKNYRKYYRQYRKMDEIDPLTFHSKVIGNPVFENIASLPQRDTKQAAKVFSKIYEGEVIAQVRDLARNRGTE